MEMFYDILIDVLTTKVYTFVKSCQIVPLAYVYFTVIFTSIKYTGFENILGKRSPENEYIYT